jgi:WD40 repeat protein
MENTLNLQEPWLVYLAMGKGGLYGKEVTGINAVNQDGTGKVFIGGSPYTEMYWWASPCEDGDPFMPEEDPSNRMAMFLGSIYLIHPPNRMNLYGVDKDYCKKIAYTGNAHGGLLASIQESGPKNLPELLLNELPGAKEINRIPLAECDDPEQCYVMSMEGFQIEWSPNGRYLAFPGIQKGPASDLFLYDRQKDDFRRLTDDPDGVSQIWWSPDGLWIILGETNNHFVPSTSSVWAVSASTGDARILYTVEKPGPQQIHQWDGNRRFLSYGAYSDPTNPEPYYSLRLVNIAGGSQTLVEGNFDTLEVDDQFRAAVVLITANDKYESGTYLITFSPPSMRLLAYGQFNLEWNSKLGLFVATLDHECETDPSKLKAYDIHGNALCIAPPWKHPTPTSTPQTAFLSPDGKWKITLKDLLFRLESADGTVMRTFDDSATQVIWSPDSKGFFFVAKQVLYYTSVSDLSRNTIDDKLINDSIIYQWVERNN